MDPQTTERIKRGIEFELARSEVPKGFPRLPDIPVGRYTDPVFYELERESLWSRSWLLAGHVDQLPEVGSFFRWDDSGVPLIVVRGEDRRIRSFYNTCTHRGGPATTEASGKVRAFRCGYHSWTFDLEGELIAVPDERDFVDLDRSCRGLAAVRCETWGGWIFVNRDPDAPTLKEYLGTIPDEIADYEVDKLRLVEKQSSTLECNWKVAMDAFLETYHLKHIHPDTVHQLLDYRGSTMGLMRNGHSRMPTPVRDERLESREPGASPLDIPSVGEIGRITNLAYAIFPNFVTPLEPTGFPILLFWPLDIRTTRFDALWFGADWGSGEVPKLWRMLIDGFGTVLAEDTQFLPWVQKSVESPALSGIPLSYQERRIYHVHEEIDRVIGVERIPEHLRVQPLLEPYLE
ncbi:MAG: (2Fe-2S)-binding protein [Deltaproteobacteria bacterium]|jgi:phenylpropionate dioxygenase-like ring-hydroxylating dioxygenase large terminal subunit|nr:(2Fe-2S)-binding protein [Deltaproteobacteria bacterium]